MADEAAFESMITLSDNVFADAAAVKSLCEREPAQHLRIGGGAFSLDLKVLGADATKSCLVALSSSMTSQHETIEEMRGDVREALVASGAGGRDHLDAEAMRAKMRELEAALTNLAQNVQGFTEEEQGGDGGEEEDSLVDDAESFVAPLPEPEEDAAAVAEAAAAREDRRTAADAATGARVFLDELDAADRRSELEALEHKHAEAQRLAAEAQEVMGQQLEAMQKALAKVHDDKAKHDLEVSQAKERHNLLERKHDAERALRESAARTSLVKSRFSTVRNRVTKARSLGNAQMLQDMAKLVEARRLWRKCIRQIIRTNRQKNNAVGVLKSRALKGQSIADRLKRMEEKNYNQMQVLKRDIDGNVAQDNCRDEMIEAMARRIDALERRLEGCASRADVESAAAAAAGGGGLDAACFAGLEEQKKVLGDVMDALVGTEQRRAAGLRSKLRDLSDRLRDALSRANEVGDELAAGLDAIRAGYENPITRDLAATLGSSVALAEVRERLSAVRADGAVLSAEVLQANGDLQAAITDGGEFAAAFRGESGGDNEDESLAEESVETDGERDDGPLAVWNPTTGLGVPLRILQNSRSAVESNSFPTVS